MKGAANRGGFERVCEVLTSAVARLAVGGNTKTNVTDTATNRISPRVGVATTCDLLKRVLCLALAGEESVGPGPEEDPTELGLGFQEVRVGPFQDPGTVLSLTLVTVQTDYPDC